MVSVACYLNDGELFVQSKQSIVLTDQISNVVYRGKKTSSGYIPVLQLVSVFAECI